MNACVQSPVSADPQTESPPLNVAPGSAARRSPVLTIPVGASLQGVTVTRQDHEVEEHILSCAILSERAYERFQQHGSHYDREEAREWLQRMQEAIGQRRAEIVRAMEQEMGLQ